VDDHQPVTSETSIFGFSGDLYGQKVEVRLLKFLRAEKRFPSVQALREQIAADSAAALPIGRSYLEGEANYGRIGLYNLPILCYNQQLSGLFPETGIHACSHRIDHPPVPEIQDEIYNEVKQLCCAKKKNKSYPVHKQHENDTGSPKYRLQF
jgi:hypothetical protein